MITFVTGIARAPIEVYIPFTAGLASRGNLVYNKMHVSTGLHHSAVRGLSSTRAKSTLAAGVTMKKPSQTEMFRTDRQMDQVTGGKDILQTPCSDGLELASSNITY